MTVPGPRPGVAGSVASHGCRAKMVHGIDLVVLLSTPRYAFIAGTVRKSLVQRKALRAAGKHSLFSVENACFSQFAPRSHLGDSFCSLHPANAAYAAYMWTRHVRPSLGGAASGLSDSVSPLLNDEAGGQLINEPAKGWSAPYGSLQYITAGILPELTCESATS